MPVEGCKEGGTGANVGAGCANTADHIGVDEIRGHFGESQWAVLCAHALAQSADSQHPA